MSSKELNELNNIKYKSNLKSLNITTKMEDDLHNLDNFLEHEKSQCNNDSWGKIDKNKRLEKSKVKPPHNSLIHLIYR